jgi:DNA polymerase/3'-5' exonuclease PolX
MSTGDRIPWEQGRKIADIFTTMICFEAHDIVVAGSLRRHKETIGDIEVVCRPMHTLDEQLEKLIATPTFKKALYRTRVGKNGEPDKYGNRWGKNYKGLQFTFPGLPEVKIELFIGDEYNYGYTLALRTGPGDANTILMSRLKNYHMPWHFKEGYARLKATGQIIAVPDEKTFFKMLGIEYIEPYKRTDQLYESMRLNPMMEGFQVLTIEETNAIDKAK